MYSSSGSLVVLALALLGPTAHASAHASAAGKASSKSARRTHHRHAIVDAATGSPLEEKVGALSRAHSSPIYQGGSNSLSVLDFGAVSDCSDLTNPDKAAANVNGFQAALDAASQGGGGVVFAPPGCYAFSGELHVSAGVALSGSWQTVPSHGVTNGFAAVDGVGTTLMPLAGRGCSAVVGDDGSTDGGCANPFITLNENAKLQGVSIFYPEQLPTEYPLSYPYSVYLVGNNPAVTDVELLNSWNGISAVGAHRHYIARVQGQPTNIGLFVDATYDIGRIEDVHWNPWYSMDAQYFSHQVIEGRAFVLGRSDWEYVFNTFAFGYAIGYHFVTTATGTMNGNFLGIGADLAYNASVQVDGAQFPGILITNGEFTAFTEPTWPCAECVSSQVRVSPSNAGPVKFVDSSFWGPAASVAVIDGSGSTTFSACEFVQWDVQRADGSPAISQVGSGALVVTGCEFLGNGGGVIQLSLGPAATKVVFMGNILNGGEERIVDNSKPAATIVGLGLNA